MYKAFATPHHWIEFGCGRHPGQIIGVEFYPQHWGGCNPDHYSLTVAFSLLFMTVWVEYAYYTVARDVSKLITES